MFQYLIFDLDDTLYSYESAHMKAIDVSFQYLSETTHVPISELRDMFKKCRKVNQSRLYGPSKHNKFIQFKLLIDSITSRGTRGIGHSRYHVLMKTYNVYYTTFLASMSVNPGVVGFLAMCRAHKIKMYVLTNNTCKVQCEKLERLGLLDYFDKIYTSEEFGHEKPNPLLFHSVLADIGCKPADVAMIGDSYNHDIVGALDAGMFAFWYEASQAQVEIHTSDDNRFMVFNHFEHITTMFEQYYDRMNECVQLSRKYGERYDLVQAGGGNTSFKVSLSPHIGTQTIVFVKASGCILTDIKPYSNYVGLFVNPIQDHIDALVKLHPSGIAHSNKKMCEKYAVQVVNRSKLIMRYNRPSIETTMHCLTHVYTVHLHPLQFNSISAKPKCQDIVDKLFRDGPWSYVFIDYVTPGVEVALAIKCKQSIDDDPGTVTRATNHSIIFLKNHGIVFTSDSASDLRDMIHYTTDKLSKYIDISYSMYTGVNRISDDMMTVFGGWYVTRFIGTADEFVGDTVDYSHPFLPDTFVYCGYETCHYDGQKSLVEYKSKCIGVPKIIKLGQYIYTTGSNMKKCREIEDVLKAHYLCQSVYGNDNIDTLDDQEMNYLNDWDAEKYRNQ